MEPSWIVVGLTGVTNGGKTTLAKNLQKVLDTDRIHIIAQDDYFLDVSDPRHIWVSEIKHMNFDIISSLDMDKMYQDITTLLNSKLFEKKPQTSSSALLNEHDNHDNDMKINLQTLSHLISENNVRVLIIEGFSIFDEAVPHIFELCHLKYFFTLDYENCKLRRSQRTYDPPDNEGYFDYVVWPEYQKYLMFVQSKYGGQIHYFHGNAKAKEVAFSKVVSDLIQIIE